MDYSLGQCLSEYGFDFYEKLHEPIFLVHKTGRIRKVNEAGRKFLNVANLEESTIEKNWQSKFARTLAEKNFFRFQLPEHHMRLIVRQLQDSDYALVEVTR